MMKTKQPKYSKVEKQHLRSVEAMSEEVADGINSKEIELGDWEENDWGVELCQSILCQS